MCRCATARATLIFVSVLLIDKKPVFRFFLDGFRFQFFSKTASAYAQANSASGVGFLAPHKKIKKQSVHCTLLLLT